MADWVRAVELALEDSDAALGQGCWNACDEAHWLVLGTLGAELDADPADLPTPSIEQSQRLRDAAEQRLTQRIPTAYILGEAWLAGIPFSSDARAIIPRSFLAFPLAEGEISLDHCPTPKILDLCTGGGSLAVIAAMAYPEAEVWAADLSTDALELASLNLSRHGLGDRIRLRCGDLWSALRDTDPQQFDLIVCNPPYVPTTAAPRFPPEFRAEPAMAHFAGELGMDIVEQILRSLGQRLRPGGQLLLEVGREAESVDPLLRLLPANCDFDWLDAPAQERAVLWVGMPSPEHP